MLLTAKNQAPARSPQMPPGRVLQCRTHHQVAAEPHPPPADQSVPVVQARGTGCCAPRPLLSQVILSESSAGGEVFFFETWMQTCMPEEGKILNPDHPCFRPDSTKVESLVALLNNSSEIKLVSVAGRPLPGCGGLRLGTPPSAPPRPQPRGVFSRPHPRVGR